MIAQLQNTIRRTFRTSPLIAAAIVLLVAPMSASGQTTPLPPDPFCAEGALSCGSKSVGTSAAKKWNPGHYLKPQGNHAQADQAGYISAITGQLGKVNDSPEIVGALVGYAWGTLEPTKGNYDWDPIYTHLNYLSARGKKLMLMVSVKCFSTDCSHLAPADMASEVIVTGRVASTSIVAIWEEQNMDVLIDLMEALAAEFDGHPALEMVVGAESAPSLQGAAPASFSNDIFAAQLKRMYTAQAAAFKTTNVIANVNFLGNQVAGLLEHAYLAAAGRGLPDVFDSAGSFVFRGECYNSDCGVRDYRGLVPHLGVVSSPTLTGKHDVSIDDPAEIIAYGLANKFTHFAWVSSGIGEDSWENIIDALETTTPNVQLACPTAYSKGCQ